MIKILERSEWTKSYDGFWFMADKKNWFQWTESNRPTASLFRAVLLQGPAASEKPSGFWISHRSFGFRQRPAFHRSHLSLLRPAPTTH
jgi:hypothetical protein